MARSIRAHASYVANWLGHRSAAHEALIWLKHPRQSSEADIPPGSAIVVGGVVSAISAETWHALVVHAANVSYVDGEQRGRHAGGRRGALPDAVAMLQVVAVQLLEVHAVPAGHAFSHAPQ